MLRSVLGDIADEPILVSMLPFRGLFVCLSVTQRIFKPNLSVIMWLYVGFLWSQGEDDMWVSDDGGQAGCSDKR